MESMGIVSTLDEQGHVQECPLCWIFQLNLGFNIFWFASFPTSCWRQYNQLFMKEKLVASVDRLLFASQPLLSVYKSMGMQKQLEAA